MNLDPLRRRALINGGIATVVTLAVGLGVVAGVTQGDDAEPPPVGPTTTPSPTPPPCVPGWEVAQSADPGEDSNTLLGIAVITPTEAWAVGGSGDPAAPTSVLIEQWDGSAWVAEEGPSPGSQVNELRAVDASEPNDVWAVGRTSSGLGDRPLVLHYDGVEWLETDLPEEVSGVLNGVAAIAPNDVWVVGYTGDPAASLERALVLHWDGLVWAVVEPGRAVGVGRSGLEDVDAASSTDVWAVGHLHSTPLAVRFDGTAWSRSETEIRGSAHAVEPLTPTEVWVAGTPLQRFDGAAWSEVVEVREDVELLDVAAVGLGDVWTVGVRPSETGPTRSFVARFDGQTWATVDGPSVPGSDALTAVDALPDGTVLGVGYRDVELGRRTLAFVGATCPAEG